GLKECHAQKQARRHAGRPGQETEILPSEPAALCPGRQGGGEELPGMLLRQEEIRIQEPRPDLPYAGILLAARNAPSQMLLNTPSLFGRKLSFGVQDQRFSYIFAVSHKIEVPFDPITKPSVLSRLCGDSTSRCPEGNR